MSNQNKGSVMSRRRLLKAGMAGIGSLAGSHLIGCAPAGKEEAESAPLKQTQTRRYVPVPNSPQHVLRVQYTDVSPDGAKVVRGVTSNGVLPAEVIRLKQGDQFRVRVENALSDQQTSIHWHGLLLPATMDGVPNVAHVPIEPNEVFVYEFPLLQSGTYWYHSHSGFQEQLGFGGPFIIDAADEALVYDHDYVIFLSDWLHADPYTVFQALKNGTLKGADKPRGPDLSDIQYNAFLLNGRGNNDPWACTAKPGDRIRFRIINGSTSTFFRFMIDAHPLTITHADGLAVQPVEVDNFFFGMGECYDALVTVRETGRFTIRAEAQDGSGQAIGVVHSPDVKPTADLSRPVWGSRRLSYSQLLAAEPTALPEGPAWRFALDLTGDMSRYIWSINNQVYPKGDRLLIKQGQRVLVEMSNKTTMWHPMHLHGHFVRLIIAGVDPRFRPLKHTVSVPPKETVRFEFFADNPGKWFFHCHNLYHMDAGMAREFVYSV